MAWQTVLIQVDRGIVTLRPGNEGAYSNISQKFSRNPFQGDIATGASAIS
jgi:hypothetical protein